MINKFSEFRVPIAVTAVGLTIVTILANPKDDSEDAEYAQLLKNNSDAIIKLEEKLENLAALSTERSSALEVKIENIYSRVENESATINKAMGRILKRIATQSEMTDGIQQSINKIGTTSSNLGNHIKTLDSAAVQQHSRHIKLRDSIANQKNELEKLLELNAQLGELFSSFGDSQ